MLAFVRTGEIAAAQAHLHVRVAHLCCVRRAREYPLLELLAALLQGCPTARRLCAAALCGTAAHPLDSVDFVQQWSADGSPTDG